MQIDIEFIIEILIWISILLFQAVFDSLSNLSNIASFFNYIGGLVVSSPMVGLATIAGTAIVFWKYMSSPELILDGDVSFPYVNNDDKRILNPSFHLVNAGNSSGQNVYMSITFCDIKIEEDQEDVVFPDEEEDDGIIETTLKIEEERSLPFIGGMGRRFDYYIDNTAYSGDRFRFYYGELSAKKDGCYKIEYITSCSSRGPLSGALYLCVSGDDVEVIRKDPATWRRWVRQKFSRGLPENPRTQRLR